MTIHRVVINGVTYGNVGSIETDTTPVYYHKVETLDGKTHQKVRYFKTISTVTFFNLLDGVYTGLRAYIKANQDEAITCGFPDDEDGFIYDDYYLTITSEKNKGYLNGDYFRNGLTVTFEKVNADE